MRIQIEQSPPGDTNIAFLTEPLKKELTSSAPPIHLPPPLPAGPHQPPFEQRPAPTRQCPAATPTVSHGTRQFRPALLPISALRQLRPQHAHTPPLTPSGKRNTLGTSFRRHSPFPQVVHLSLHTDHTPNSTCSSLVSIHQPPTDTHPGPRSAACAKNKPISRATNITRCSSRSRRIHNSPPAHLHPAVSGRCSSLPTFCSVHRISNPFPSRQTSPGTTSLLPHPLQPHQPVYIQPMLILVLILQRAQKIKPVFLAINITRRSSRTLRIHTSRPGKDASRGVRAVRPPFPSGHKKRSDLVGRPRLNVCFTARKALPSKPLLSRRGLGWLSASVGGVPPIQGQTPKLLQVHGGRPVPR